MNIGSSGPCPPYDPTPDYAEKRTHDAEGDHDALLHLDALCSQHPDTVVCIDHMSSPVQPNDAEFFPCNIWEWTADTFVNEKMQRKEDKNITRRSYVLLKGGSFLCHKSYCYRHRGWNAHVSGSFP